MTRRTNASETTPAERRWAAVDRMVSRALLALGAAAVALAVVAAGHARVHRQPLHPDAVLFPLVGVVPLFAFGALFRVAERAMRRGAPARWSVQAAVVLMPLGLAVFILLSLL